MPKPAAARVDVPLGATLRGWRKVAGLSLMQVSQRSGLSIGYISQVERDLANPSLETLKRLTSAVDRQVGELFAGAASAPAGSSGAAQFWVTRRDTRRAIDYPGLGIRNELLSPGIDRKLEVIWVEAEAGSDSGDHPHSHVGEECGVIFEGCMRLWIGDECQDLFPGDSVYLESTIPHRWLAAGQDPLRALWVVTPPTF